MQQDRIDNTKRLARNTLYLYFRSIFCLLISLYSSRLILQALGENDYGINNAVAGFASMFTLVTGSLSSAISRFLTYAQGTGDQERQNRVFSLSLNLMIGFALLILLLAETAGIWFVQNKMTIPPGREIAALWAFRFAVLTVMTGLIVSPFNSAIISHERMGIYAIINIIEAVLRLGLALFLTFGRYTLDKLILYAAIWAICTVSIQLFSIVFASYQFRECRFRLIFEKSLFKELFGYAGWNFIGSFSSTLSGQGINTLINVFLGPAVNAARGLSSTVQRAITMFVNNFTIALTPQITKAYAAKEVSYVKYLTFRGSRFSFFIMYLFSLPVILETQFLFKLWLVDVPEYTIDFNRLSLINILMSLFYTVFVNIQNATGKIRTYSLITSLIVVLHFPLSWISLKMGAEPQIIYLIGIGLTVLSFFATHAIVRRSLYYSYSELNKELFLPALKVILCSLPLPLLSVLLLPTGWWRFLTTGTLCVLFTIPSILFLGCSKGERTYVFNVIKSKISDLFGK